MELFLKKYFIFANNNCKSRSKPKKQLAVPLYMELLLNWEDTLY